MPPSHIITEASVQPIAVPLVLQFLIGFTNQPLFTVSEDRVILWKGYSFPIMHLKGSRTKLTLHQSLNTILVDLNPSNPASVQAASNIVRCLLAAVLLAVVDRELRSLGPGWTFVIFAAIHGSTFPIVLAFVRLGPGWRRPRD